MDNPPIAVGKDHVDGETHGHGMYGLRRINEQASTRFEAARPQQPDHAAEICLGDHDPVAEHTISGDIRYRYCFGRHLLSRIQLPGCCHAFPSCNHDNDKDNGEYACDNPNHRYTVH
jgi:hypothetical protein